MKYAIFAAVLLSSVSAFAEDFASPSDGKPVEPQQQFVYADLCQGDNQPAQCAYARNDARVQGSEGGSNSSSD